MKKDCKCTESATKKNEWRYIFPCNVSPEAVRKALTDKTSFDAETNFDEINDEFLKGVDYISLVPIEIALDMDSRFQIRELSPSTTFIVTGIREADIERLISLGFEVVNMAPYEDKKAEEAPVNPKDILKNHSWTEIRDALRAFEKLKPLFELLGEDLDNIKPGTTVKVTIE